MKKPDFVRRKGKGSNAEVLPNRHALAQVTQGDPAQRSLNNYSKLSPASLDIGSPSILDMGKTIGS